MNNLFKDKGNIKVWGVIALAIIGISAGSYFLFSRLSQTQENLPANSIATTTTSVTEGTIPAPALIPTATTQTSPLPIAQPKPKPPVPIVPAPAPAVIPAPPQPAAINWIGTWQGPMKITAPADCASKTGQDADLAIYITGITDNKISGRMTAFGLDSDGTQSIIESGIVDGDKFSFTANGIAPALTMAGNISGDTLSVKSISAKDCGAIITENPVQLLRVK